MTEWGTEHHLDFDPPEYILESEHVRKQMFRKGTRGGIYAYTVKGVPRHYWQILRDYANADGRSFNVWLCLLAEAARDNRLLILPPGYSLDTLIDTKVRALIEAEAEKTTLRVLSEQQPEVDPYRR